MLMLGDTHSVIRDNRIGLRINIGGIDHSFPIQSRRPFQIVPALLTAKRCEFLETGGMRFDKIDVDNSMDTDTYRRSVSARPDLMILGADARAAYDHLQRILRIGEALKPTLAKGIEGDDGHAALRGFLQRMQHARRIGRRVVTEEENAISMLEILEQHRTDRRANNFRQRDGCRLVAHVRTVGKMIATVHSSEQLVHVARLQRSAAGSVENHLPWIERLKLPADFLESEFPGNRNVFIADPIVTHRRRKTAL